jgi:transposase
MNFSGLRIFLCTTPTSMSYSFDRLMGLAQQTFEQDPLSGHLFLFLNRERDRIKILFWDRDGFCIWYKRLEAGTFQLPTVASHEQGIELDSSQLAHLLGGIDLRTGRRRKRYRSADKFVRQANSFNNALP